MKHYGSIAISGTRSDTPGSTSIQYENTTDAIVWGLRQDTGGGLAWDRYSSGWTEAFRINDNKVVVLQAGINFPSAQNASANVNTLDDYEEGSWTPVVGGATSESGQSYVRQLASYRKIGSLVYVRAEIILATKGTIAGSLQIKGLPFTVLASYPGENILAIAWATTSTNFVNMFAMTGGGATAATLYGTTGTHTTAFTPLTTTDINDSSSFTISGCYLAAN